MGKTTTAVSLGGLLIQWGLRTPLSEIEDITDEEAPPEIKGVTPAADMRKQESRKAGKQERRASSYIPKQAHRTPPAAKTSSVTREESDEPIIPVWVGTGFQLLMFQVQGPGWRAP
ncbi:MAG: hypothetical protein ABFR65_11220 [Pseudomonadota bacterium]